MFIPGTFLTAVKFHHKTGHEELWEFDCVCGKRTIHDARSVRRGRVTSCGCLSNEFRRAANTTHGQSRSNDGKKTPEYSVYTAIISRCYNKNHPEYKNYGARGIVMCDRWRESFLDFLSDVGTRPSRSHSLDRFPDNDGNYEPGNVRWATPAQQSANRRVCHRLTIGSETMTGAEWARRLGVTKTTVYTHIKLSDFLTWAIGRLKSEAS